MVSNKVSRTVFNKIHLIRCQECKVPSGPFQKLSSPFIRHERCNEIIYVRVTAPLWFRGSAHQPTDQRSPSFPSNFLFSTCGRFVGVKLIHHLGESSDTARCVTEGTP